MLDYSRQYSLVLLNTFPLNRSIYGVLDNGVWQDGYSIDNGAVLRVYLNMDN